MKILLTGGLGFIGSHTAVELLNQSNEVVIVDNLSNSKIEVLDKIKEITKKEIFFYKADVCNKKTLRTIFKDHKIDAVIHFAGYKAVAESVKEPLMYYRNNIDATLSLCEVMSEFDCKKLVFSSSATVYKEPDILPIKENFPLGAGNPYGATKLAIEGILNDLYLSDPKWSIAILRYFNPAGAHKSGLLGENPNGIPNNLMPYIVKVATGELPYLNIFGNDYPTKDGTGVRDYLHIADLALGHVKAIEKVTNSSGIDAYNLGTGVGYSVLDIVKTFEKVNKIHIKYKISEKRPGDIAEVYADVSYAKQELGFATTKTLEEMCKDSFNFEKLNKKSQ